MNEPVLDAIANHSRIDVRLKAVHLLAATRQPGTFDQLRELALRDGISEVVKTALLEGMYKLDQVRLQQDEGVEQAFEFHGQAEADLTPAAEKAWPAETRLEVLGEVNETMFAFSPTPDDELVVSELSDTPSEKSFDVSTFDFEYFASEVEHTPDSNDESQTDHEI